jgi:hypothetical protein
MAPLHGPNGGVAASLDEAKAAFRAARETAEMKNRGAFSEASHRNQKCTQYCCVAQ